MAFAAVCLTTVAQGPHRGFRREAFTTETPMVHDPVMAKEGGTLFIEGDKKEWEAAGHCAAYNFDGEDIFICHGYSATQNGAALLIQRPIKWTTDGWPEL